MTSKIPPSSKIPKVYTASFLPVVYLHLLQEGIIMSNVICWQYFIAVGKLFSLIFLIYNSSFMENSSAAVSSGCAQRVFPLVSLGDRVGGSRQYFKMRKLTFNYTKISFLDHFFCQADCDLLECFFVLFVDSYFSNPY